MTDFFQTQRTLFAHGCGTGIYNCAPGVRPRLRNQVAFCNKKNRPFHHVPLVLEMKTTIISKRIRKDSFSQYLKSGKIVLRNVRIREDNFWQFDHITTYLFAKYNGKPRAKIKGVCRITELSLIHTNFSST